MLPLQGAGGQSVYSELRMRAILREAIETVALAIFLVLLVQTAVQNYRVEGPSMLPLLQDYDRVLVSRLTYVEIDAERVARWVPWLEVEPGAKWRPLGEPQYGDVVVFKWPRNPEQYYVKRIIGLPGDAIRVERGNVYRNGELLDEPYVEHEASITLVQRTVQDGQYYVMGDNRAQSEDSRHWGGVPKENIIGNVWLSYWPLDRIGTVFAGDMR